MKPDSENRNPPKTNRGFLRRAVFLAACLATLVAVFYAVENWRGKRNWQRCRSMLEARGAKLDWATYIPPAIPDEQNLWKAPNIAEWFTKGKTSELGERLKTRRGGVSTPVIAAKITVVLNGTNPDSKEADVILRLDDPATGEQAAKLIQDALGPSCSGAQGPTLVTRAPDHIKPVRILMTSERGKTIKDIEALFHEAPAGEISGGDGRIPLQIRALGSNEFQAQVRSKEVITTEDYLAWSDPFETDFDLIRDALKRPAARMDGDYTEPYDIPIPNFINIRQTVQTLAMRAQCHLLQGQPDQAWHDLSLVHDFCGLLKPPPNGQPMTLVAAMINVAVTGLYTAIVADGLRLHAWREQELAAIEKQLSEVNLLPYLSKSFEAERACTHHIIETSDAAKLNSLFALGEQATNLWQRLTNPMLVTLRLMPSGWLYQNMAVGAQLEQNIVDSLDLAKNLVIPQKVDNLSHEFETSISRWSPYTFIVAAAIPNFSKATQTMARNQAGANLALLACALERYHLVHHEYPKSLDALVPEFVSALPHDPIGGQALKYHLTGQDFVLYSVGWNRRDDGGIPGESAAQKDWVW